MTLQKMNIGTWEEDHPLAGQPKWHYYSDDPINDPLHAVVTGPIFGKVTVPDGTEFDVTEHVIEAPLQYHGAIACAIGKRHEVEGHPSHAAGEPFVHEHSDMCTADVPHSVDTLALMNSGGSAGAQMALASTAAENQALAGLAGQTAVNVIPDVSLHTATTSTTGAAENANAGSYARQACSWNTPSSGAMTNSSSLSFSTLGTIAVTYIGTWSSATYAAGTFAIGAALGASVTAATITVAAGAISLSAS